MIKKVVIVCLGQPSTNPRTIKEAKILNEKGFEVIVIYNFWTAWAIPFDERIIKENSGIRWQMAGADPFTNKAAYNFSRLRFKYFCWLNKMFPKKISYAMEATIRGFSSLSKAVLKIQADLYIAHNLGALPVAAMAAKKSNTKYGFDAEDYHRGQEIMDSVEQKRTIILEDKYLPGASYITAASPLIAEQYSKLYNRPVKVINNVFSKKHLTETIKKTSKPIKLFWFSQTIGKGRGLEDVILALKEMPADAFKLTLLGKHEDAIKNYFTELGKNKNHQVDIQFLPPVFENEIFEIAAQHDIGLALETGRDENNNLALSNKIFTYILVGNAIIFSDTKAQKKFYEDNEKIGLMFPSGNKDALLKIFSFLMSNPDTLDFYKNSSLRLANSSFNWEFEKEKFIKIIESIK